MELSVFKERLAEPCGWFVFAGEEDYLKRFYLGELKARLVPDAFTEAFNYIVFDGAEPDVARLTEAVKAPPMMSDKKLVVWKYADFEKMKESTRRSLDELLALREEYAYTVLVFVVTPEGFDVGTLPKRPSKLYTKYSRLVDIVDFRLSTDAQLLAWLKKHAEADGCTASAPALRLLLERAGHGMQTLHNEITKLCGFVRENGRVEITEDDVRAVAATTFESEAFALSNALLAADRHAAFTALRTLRAERAEPTAVVGMMARTYAELHAVAMLLEEGCEAAEIATRLGLNPYKVKLSVGSVKRQGGRRLRAALNALGRLDVRMKTSGVRPDFSELERFVAGYLMD